MSEALQHVEDASIQGQICGLLDVDSIVREGSMSRTNSDSIAPGLASEATSQSLMVSGGLYSGSSGVSDGMAAAASAAASDIHDSAELLRMTGIRSQEPDQGQQERARVLRQLDLMRVHSKIYLEGQRKRSEVAEAEETLKRPSDSDGTVQVRCRP